MKVLLIILLVLLVLLLIPFGGVARYDQDGFMAWVKVLFFRIQVFPAKKEKGEKKPKEKKPKKETEKPPQKKDPGKEDPEKKGDAENKDGEQKESEKKEKKGGKLELVQAALPLIKPALSGLKKRLTINDLELLVTWRSDDPADAALGYGRANAALGVLWALIDTNFKVKKSRLGCRVDFEPGKSDVYANATLTLNLWKVLTLVIPLAIRFFRNYSRLKKAGDDKTKKEA